MKKQAPPAPTSRAAALSQSASRFSAGAASTWQSIAGKSPRLAAAGRPAPGAARSFAPLAQPTAPGANHVAMEPQRLAEPVAPAAAPETVRQVGWREIDRAVGVSTKRKYSLFGLGFGPKVPVFETEKVKLPVYQETDRQKRYYAVVKQEDVARIKREGLIAQSGDKSLVPLQTIKQYNTRGQVYFFSDKTAALSYGRKNIDGNCAIVEFVLPEYQEFMPDLSADSKDSRVSKTPALQTSAQSILVEHIKAITASPKA